MALDVMNVLMMSGSWSYGGVSSFFLHGTHLKVNLPEGLDACGAFAFEARIYLKDADFCFPWSIEWNSTLQRDILEDIHPVGTRGFLITDIGWELKKGLINQSATTLNDSFCFTGNLTEMLNPSLHRSLPDDSWTVSLLHTNPKCWQSWESGFPLNEASSRSGFINKIRSRFILDHSFESEKLLQPETSGNNLAMRSTYMVNASIENKILNISIQQSPAYLFFELWIYNMAPA